jgi:mannose-6-phosphate isomerase-like protein (cupin superfamily)
VTHNIHATREVTRDPERCVVRYCACNHCGGRRHHNAEEILILEEGGATVVVGDKWAVTGPHSITFIPRDTWISATNKGKENIHTIAIFSRQGFDRYMRSIGAKPGTPISPVSPDELPRLRALGHATYWDTSKGPYPPGVAHP